MATEIATNLDRGRFGFLRSPFWLKQLCSSHFSQAICHMMNDPRFTPEFNFVQDEWFVRELDYLIARGQRLRRIWVN